MIRTDPPAGELVPQDTTINLVVSSGPDQVAMPSTVIGETEADARAVLENEPYNFRSSRPTEETRDVAAGLVIRTNPAAQTLVAKGGAGDDLRVERRARRPRCPTSSASPRRRPGRAGRFDVSVMFQDLPFGDGNDGRVIAQSVAGGQRAPEGRRSQLTVGRAAAPPPTTAAPTPRPTTAPPTTAATDDHHHHRRGLIAVAWPVPSFGTVVWVAIGLLIGVVVWKTGIAMLRSLTRPLPPPPPPGEMRKVNVRYRCDVCGVELRLTMAPDEDPPPPKHCLEDMVLVAPVME